MKKSRTNDPEMVDLETLTLSPELLVRCELNQGRVDEYAERMLAGDEFPPVVAFRDGAQLWLADGFHRWHAAQKIGRATIATEIRSGDRRAGLLHATSANGRHGLSLTNAEKRKAVLVLLDDSEWAKWSDRQIAKHIGVSQPFVSKVRKDQRGDNGYHPAPAAELDMSEYCRRNLGPHLPDLTRGVAWVGLTLEAKGRRGGMIYLVPWDRAPDHYWIQLINCDDESPTLHTKKPVLASFVELMLENMMDGENWGLQIDLHWSESGMSVDEVHEKDERGIHTGNWFGGVRHADQAQFDLLGEPA